MNYAFHTLRFITKMHLTCYKNVMGTIIFNNGPKLHLFKMKREVVALRMDQLIFVKLRNKRSTTS